jgi:hypothetical protein
VKETINPLEGRGLEWLEWVDALSEKGQQRSKQIINVFAQRKSIYG